MRDTKAWRARSDDGLYNSEEVASDGAGIRVWNADGDEIPLVVACEVHTGMVESVVLVHGEVAYDDDGEPAIIKQYFPAPLHVELSPLPPTTTPCGKASLDADAGLGIPGVSGDDELQEPTFKSYVEADRRLCRRCKRELSQGVSDE